MMYPAGVPQLKLPCERSLTQVHQHDTIQLSYTTYISELSMPAMPMQFLRMVNFSV